MELLAIQNQEIRSQQPKWQSVGSSDGFSGVPPRAPLDTAVSVQGDQESLAQVVVAIGSSAGGVEALLELMRVIPLGSSQAFLIYHHFLPGFKSDLPELLSRYSLHLVQEAYEGAPLVSGAVYLAPPAYFMTVSKSRVCLRVRRESDPHCFLPIDQLFKSLAAEYGDSAIAVVLSGAGSDGIEGAQEIRKRGGQVLVQDARTVAFAGMIRGVKDLKIGHEELPLAMIPSRIESIAKNRPPHQLWFRDQGNLDQTSDLCSQEIRETHSGVSYDTPDVEFRVNSLAFDLDLRNAELVRTIRRLEAANETMRSTETKLQAALLGGQVSQSELQTINQELLAMNAEAQSRIKELTETTGDLQKIYKTCQMGTLIIALDGKILKFNKFIQKAFHLVQEDMGRSIQDYSGVLPEGFFDKFNAILADYEDLQGELVTHDGVMYLIRMSPYRNQRLEVEGIIVILIDISYLKERLGELESMREDFQFLSRMCPDLVVKLALNGAVLEGNQHYETLFGIQEYPSFELRESIVTDDRVLFEDKLMLQRKQGGSFSQFQVRHQLSQGSVTSLFWSFKSHPRSDGLVAHIIGVGKVLQ